MLRGALADWLRSRPGTFEAATAHALHLALYKNYLSRDPDGSKLRFTEFLDEMERAGYSARFVDDPKPHFVMALPGEIVGRFTRKTAKTRRRGCKVEGQCADARPAGGVTANELRRLSGFLTRYRRDRGPARLRAPGGAFLVLLVAV